MDSLELGGLSCRLLQKVVQGAMRRMILELSLESCLDVGDVGSSLIGKRLDHVVVAFDFSLKILPVLLVNILVTLFINTMELIKLLLILLQSLCVGVFEPLILLLNALLIGLITLTQQLSELSQLLLVLVIPIFRVVQVLLI